jgi:hypothetical protein
MRFDKTDALAGGIFILFGLIFGLQSLGLDLGTARNMGPGYFPLVLSAVLILLGGIVLAGSLRGTPQEIGPWALRGMLWILPAPLVFGLTVRGLGFVPSIFLTTLIAARASFHLGVGRSFLLAVAVTAFSTLVFSYALGLPFRRFGPWLDPLFGG